MERMSHRSNSVLPLLPDKKNASDSWRWPLACFSIILTVLTLAGCSASSERLEKDSLANGSPLTIQLNHLTERMFASRSVGTAWVWMEDGKIIAEGYRGMARLDHEPGGSVPVTAETPFHIASSSKPVTAAALLLAMRDEDVTLDSPFAPLLEGRINNISEGFRNVTIRQLLDHTSGIPFGYAAPPLEESLEPFLDHDPKPGAIGKRTYSNLNYTLVRMLAEVLSKSDYESFVRKRVVAATAGSWDVDFVRDRVTLAYRFGQERQAGSRWDKSFAGEAGPYGWHTTARSLAAFGDAIARGDLLDPDDTEAMLTEGVGFGIFRSINGSFAGHHGQWTMPGNTGFESAICIFPGGITGAVLMNSTRAQLDPVGGLKTVYEALLPIIRRAPSDSPTSPALRINYFDEACTLRWDRGGAVTPHSTLCDSVINAHPGDQIGVRAFVDQRAGSFTRFREVEVVIPSTDP